MKTLNGYCTQYQRDCAEIEKSCLTRLVLTDDPKRIDQMVQSIVQLRHISPEEAKATILVGNTEEVKKQVQAYLDAGITHIIIGVRQPYDREGLQRFAKEVMPAFR